jgi:hypothetical protein
MKLLMAILITAGVFFISCSGGGSSGIDKDDLYSANMSSVGLNWMPPSQNSDGSYITDLAGYKVYYGRSLNDYTQSVDVGNYTEVVINLESGTWCFAVTAYDVSGNESNYSEGMCASV